MTTKFGYHFNFSYNFGYILAPLSIKGLRVYVTK